MKKHVKDYLSATIGLGFFTALFIQISVLGIAIGLVFWALMLTPMLITND